LADEVDVEDEIDEVEDTLVRRKLTRADDISNKPGVKKAILDKLADVQQGFTDQQERSNDIVDYWSAYNCELGPKQFYSGNSKIFVPLIHQAVNARITRFTNQMFPMSGRYVDVTSQNQDLPHAMTALLEHYVRKAQMRTKVAAALIKNGDIEGQYTVCVGWQKVERHVVYRTKNTPQVDGDIDIPGAEAGEEIEDIVEETIVRQNPTVEVVADTDFLVLPQTADTIDEALAAGGSVTIMRRWGKAKIRQMIRDGLIDKKAGQDFLKAMTGRASDPNRNDTARNNLDAAGIRMQDGGQAIAQVFETWTNLKVEGETRLCVAYGAGEDNILGVRRNPYWSDRCPIFSAPVEKVAGVFKGQSKLKFCVDMQYAANDAVNEAMDSAAYALMPIVMTDPAKNPRIGSMVLNMAAIWETSPQDTQFANFPALWKDGFEIVSAAKESIFESLSVNPAMMTRQGSMKRLNQAEVANEQQVDILTTADAVTILEEGILTPLLSFWVELDHQYREDDVYVRQYGDMGVRAVLEKITPIQMGERFTFQWAGVEAARNAQQIQTQVGAINVLRGIPPQQYPGYRLNLIPVITTLVENVFGPRIGPLTFENVKDQMSLDAKMENRMLAEGFDLDPHPFDNDMQHIQEHMAEFQATGDPSGAIRAHIQKHQQAAQEKAKMQMQMQLQQQGGMPGVPGGGGQPGVAGTPRPGAMPEMPRQNGGFAGAIHPDSMNDPSVMPRQ